MKQTDEPEPVCTIVVTVPNGKRQGQLIRTLPDYYIAWKLANHRLDPSFRLALEIEAATRRAIREQLGQPLAPSGQGGQE